MDIMTFFYVGCLFMGIAIAVGTQLLDRFEEKKSKKDSSYHFYA